MNLSEKSIGGDSPVIETLRTIKDMPDISGKIILLRSDFNVPVKDGVITDNTRIVRALPTIRELQEKGAKVVLISHFARPKGERLPEYSLNPVAKELSKLMGQPVLFADDCIGSGVQEKIDSLGKGEVLLLENVRYHAEEVKNDPDFSKKLASLADYYVNDAFGSAHRAHASTEGITKYIPSYAGTLIEKEFEYFGRVLSDPARPFVAIVGGAKVSSKIGILKNLIDQVDTLLIGGGMSYTFLKAAGYEIGNSLFEEDFVEAAGEIMAYAREKNVKLLNVEDVVVADDFAADANSKVVAASAIEAGWEGLDIGPETVKIYSEIVSKAGTVLWNGPLGVFEMEKFAIGTNSVGQAVADTEAVTIVGGGDSVAAVNQAGLADKIDHISTGGGAALEMLEGKTLPGIAALMGSPILNSDSIFRC